jgi:predicted DNA-binding transcriptional regulator YafY
VYFRSKVKHIYSVSDGSISNAQLFYTVDILDEAIEKKMQVEFEYCSYDVDKKLHPRKGSDGKIRKYVVNPYQMAVISGRYYLICNYDKYDNIANYRIDRIKNIRILDTSIKPFEKTQGKKYGLDLSEHIKEHIYMFSSDIIQVKFRANRYIINDVIDYFGKAVAITDVTDNDCIVRVRVSEEDMFKWAVQYSDHAAVISPVSLRERVIEALKNAIKNYEEV